MDLLKPFVLFVFSFGPMLLASAGGTGPAALPAVGALVRVEAPRLGPGWHLGMFNRLRVEPPCYRVVIFSKDGSNRITHVLELKDIERMQTHLVYKGRHKVAPPRVLAGGKVSDEWAEVPMDVFRASVPRCPS